MVWLKQDTARAVLDEPTLPILSKGKAKVSKFCFALE
jgi:hypothetical protein